MRYYFLFFITIATIEAIAQEPKKDSIIYASPKGGWDKFRSFVDENLTYPEGASIFRENRTVTVKFIINEDGSLSDFFRFESGNALLREEAIRVLKLSPNWIPAKKNDTLIKQTMKYDFCFVPPLATDEIPIDKKLLSLEIDQNEDHFGQVVDFGTYEFDSQMSILYPIIDTNSYHANPELGFEGFGLMFKKIIVKDQSFKSVNSNISVTFEVLDNGDLTNFTLSENPHTNDTAVVRTLMNLGKWDPGYKDGLPTKQKIKLNFKYYTGEIFEKVDVPAMAPEDYLNFVEINLVYPYKAMINNISGYVTATFVVEKDGSTTNGEIVESLGYGCDEEVLKLITLMPKWTSAFHDGTKVRQRITERFFFSPF